MFRVFYSECYMRSVVETAWGLGWLNLRNWNGFELDDCRFLCLGLPPNTLLLCESVDLSDLWFV